MKNMIIKLIDAYLMQTNNINVLVDIIHFIQSISYSKIDVSVSIIVVSVFFIINSISQIIRYIVSHHIK